MIITIFGKRDAGKMKSLKQSGCTREEAVGLCMSPYRFCLLSDETFEAMIKYYEELYDEV